MNALDPKLRRDLERAIIKARDVAEDAAEKALDQLAVGEPKFHAEMTSEQKELRKRLRAKGRQLGDIKDEKKRQSIHRLIAECAYENWHQMLFARFLAENNLLMNPDNVPVAIAECEELGRNEKPSVDGWTLASRYASRMLPQIFRPHDAMLQVQFAPEHLHELEALLSSLPTDVFTADDSLGWVYQFWQSKKKDEVNKSEKKIGADELPAVTQLFTEDYMVLFLLHNTIGAWWTARLLDDGKISKEKWSKCTSEDDCRHLVATGAIAWEYLRFVKDEQTGESRPAAGSFDGWPKCVRELTVLDPCCGSGHFLVAAFIILVYLLMEEEGLAAQDASDVVIKDCLFGLEIDQRCTQIAAFALAFAAWKFGDTCGYRALPQLNIACSGLSVGADKKEWVALANGDTRLKAGMERLYNLFKQAPTLGSLINPRTGGYDDMMEAGFGELRPLLETAVFDKERSGREELKEIGVVAQGLTKALRILSTEFWLVVTNVPYLKRGRMEETLYQYCKQRYADSSDDLATVFLTRCAELNRHDGASVLVTPQNWMFHQRSAKLRKRTICNSDVNLFAILGPGAFTTISGEVVNVAMFVITKSTPNEKHCMVGMDVTGYLTAETKSMALRDIVQVRLNQLGQLSNPDARIVLHNQSGDVLLNKYATSAGGMQTFDKPRFIFCFWELGIVQNGWIGMQTTVDETTPYGGRHTIVRWENAKGGLYQLVQGMAEKGYKSGVWRAGFQVWEKKGVLVSLMGKLRCTLYTGGPFDNTTGVIIPKLESQLPQIWAYCSSPEFNVEVRKIDKKLAVTNGTLVKIPFDLKRWSEFAGEKDSLPTPSSNEPTQSLFKGTIESSTEPLQVAVVRLLGYHWPEQKSDKLDKHADDDGVVGIPAIMREKPAAERLRELLAAAYGKEWSPAKEAELLHSVGFGDSNLEEWLRNGFFEQHCKLFHQRPFIWHIWDGRKDGFSVLINYHKLNHQLLERVTYTYLNDWIKRQEDSTARHEGGAEARLIAAKDLQKKLKLILDGEPLYDIFVRWKPIEQQPIGWNPDLNDGVRLNIRPFVEANVLRKRPNIKWGVDRGKDVESAPWYKLFKGERINDHHLTTAEKKQARQQKEQSKQIPK